MRNLVLPYLKLQLYFATFINNIDGWVNDEIWHMNKVKPTNYVVYPYSFHGRELQSKPNTDNALSSVLLSSGKALSSGQNPASQQFLFSKSSQ